MTQPIIAANWKMNGTKAEALAWIDGLDCPAGVTAVLCLPSVLLGSEAIQQAANAKGVALAGQDCHAETSGAFTGWEAATMLKEAGATYVIVGHSERRDMAGETSAQVKAKAEAALAAGITPIICLGEPSAEETLEARQAFVAKQVQESVPTSGQVVVAYEPIWAIGTGLVPTTDDIEKMQGLVVAELAKLGVTAPVQYGGSAKPANAGEILALEQVGGLLVGGASLKADSFSAICNAA